MLRKLLELFVFVVLVILVSAILSPLAYWAVEAFFPGAVPFRRVFNRCVMIAPLLLMWPFAKYWGVAGWRKIGIVVSGKLSLWTKGVALGIITVSFFFVLHLIAGIMQWEWTLQAKHLAGFVFGAIAIGFLEELLFRGLLFNALREQVASYLIPWAIVISFIYAASHFIDVTYVSDTITWDSGWRAWLSTYPELAMSTSLFQRCFALLLVGLILVAATWRTGNIWLSIGLHTGWVITLKTSDKLSTVVPGKSHVLFGTDLITGAIPLTLLVVVLFATLYWKRCTSCFGSKN